MTILLGLAPAQAATPVTYVQIDSEAVGREMNYAVYTPPGWDGETSLPLVMFLHGGGDDYTVLDKHPVVTRTFDRMIESGELPPFLLVAPDGKRSFWRNWADGTKDYEDWVLDEVIPDVTARYNVRSGPEDLHLMGISMGGAGSLYIGTQHLDRFASISAWSAPLFTPEDVERFLGNKMIANVFPVDEIFGQPTIEEIQARSVWTLLDRPESLEGTRFLIGAGTIDMRGIPKSNKKFHEHLSSADVPHRYVVYKGGHRWVDWAKVFPVALCHHLTPDTCDLAPSRFYTVTESSLNASNTSSGSTSAL
jgi:enterochelin esterase-like enzyme